VLVQVKPGREKKGDVPRDVPGVRPIQFDAANGLIMPESLSLVPSFVYALSLVRMGSTSQEKATATAARHQTITAPAGKSMRVDKTSPDK
jgi:hypothetical protein